MTGLFLPIHSNCPKFVAFSIPKCLSLSGSDNLVSQVSLLVCLRTTRNNAHPLLQSFPTGRNVFFKTNFCLFAYKVYKITDKFHHFLIFHFFSHTLSDLTGACANLADCLNNLQWQMYIKGICIYASNQILPVMHPLCADAFIVCWSLKFLLFKAS